MKILCVLGEHNYGNPARGPGYEYVNFIPSLRRLGHDVSHFESFSRGSFHSFAELNGKLLERVAAELPDMIFFVLLGYEVWLETLELIREGSNAILVNWGTDDSWKYEQHSRFIAPAFDLYVTTYQEALAKAVSAGAANFYLSQWAVTGLSLQEPLPARDCRYQVSFVGTCYGNRRRWVAELAKLGVKVECFGFGWPNGPIPQNMVSEIIQNSVISLNFGDSGIQWRNFFPLRSRQIKARLFEVAGMGGCLMTEPATDLDNCFQVGEELVTFNSADDLARKLAVYLNQPEERDRIAQAGQRRVALEHTYEARFAALLEAAVRRRRPFAGQQIDMKKFISISKRHEVGFGLSLFRLLLVLPCILLWGRARGARAARRFLLEASWRLVGRHTYTAGGWPGRLFYRES